jgi:single-strand DNA-binding protein
MSLNKILLIGHVGQIEIKSFEGQNGPRKCATFSLATTERYKDRNGKAIDNTEWHNIVSWNHAEFCEKYVQKGSQLFIEGRLRTRSWEDKQGNKRYVTEVLADKIDLLGKREGTSEKPQPSTPTPAQKINTTPLPAAGEPEDGDLPF